MIDFVFTLDYEIYGNGSGTLRDLVLDPTQQLANLFAEFGVPFVVFAEALEFAKIEEAQSDLGISEVRAQMRELRAAGHEIALHLHPWWANARFVGGQWQFDWSERNICTLRPDRVEAIVSSAVRYLRDALQDSEYIPLSYRAGLWTMQPTAVIASVLARHGVRIDSSVFKGGRTRDLGLDYRPARANGDLWRFGSDVNMPDPNGSIWELPIHTEMVPFWRMLGNKRLGIQSKSQNAGPAAPIGRDRRDFLRLRYPRKLDFCRMTFEEMRDTVSRVLDESLSRPDQRKIVVAIGHSKDLVDFGAIRQFLAFLRDRSVTVTTLPQALSKELQSSC